MTVFSSIWDATFESLPTDSEDAKDGASRIRDLKIAVQERGEVDHSWAGDAHDGKHKKITIRVSAADPTLDTGDGGLYTKAVSGINELFFKDSAGVVQQLTSAGYLSVWTTGDVKITLKTTADAGWVLMNDGTIGNASSGGTTRANADTSALFTLLWNNTADADCAVSSGRGANAAADFAADKTIALPKALGRALAVYGAGSGLTSRALAKIIGTETHALTEAELASHAHAVVDNGHLHSTGGQGVNYASGGANPSMESGSGVYNTASATTGISIAAAGSGTAHNNMQPTTFLNVMIKL